MKAKISSIRENPLLDRREAEVRVEHEGEPTPGRENLKSRIAAEHNLDEENVEVEDIHTGFGSNVSNASVKILEDFDYDEDLEEETVQKQDGETEKTGEYEEIVSSTITDAKDQLKQMEDANWEAALEAEKQNKNRKTFIEWLENKA